MTLENFVLAAICTLIGIAAGLYASRFTYMAKVGAVLHIDKSNEEKDIYRIILLMPFDELDQCEYVRMKIENGRK